MIMPLPTSVRNVRRVRGGFIVIRGFGTVVATYHHFPEVRSTISVCQFARKITLREPVGRVRDEHEDEDEHGNAIIPGI